MLFSVEKLIEILAQPGNVLVLTLMAGAFTLFASGGRYGLGLVAVVTVILAAIMILPLGAVILRPLEDRFPSPVPMPAKVDGIVLLGGAVDTDLTAARRQVALSEAAERLTATIALSLRYPAAGVLVSGGNGGLAPAQLTEAAVMRRLLVEDGIPAERILPEDRSRNTYENAVYSKEVAAPQPGQVWLLVTSAAHMPRAVGCFRAVNWTVVPYPVDYRTGRPLIEALFEFSRNLEILEYALHEWVGLVGYRLTGRIGSFFPAPNDN